MKDIVLADDAAEFADTIAKPATRIEQNVQVSEEKKSRFATVSSEELDDIEINRCSHNTKKQTAWAVHILRGMLTICSFGHSCNACLFNIICYCFTC